MYNISDMNEIYKNNFNLYKENQIFTKIYNKENINQFLTEDKVFENSNEDPNSKENLKKIEEQITSLLFSSQKLNNTDNKNSFETDSKELKVILENDNNKNNKMNSVNKNFDKKDNKINKKKSGTSMQLKGKPSLSRLISQLDSMVEKDNNNYNLVNSKSKENNNIPKSTYKSNDGPKCYKHSLNNKKSIEGIHNFNHVKNTLHNKPLYQETIVKSSKSQYINNTKELIQNDYENSELNKSDSNLFIQNNNILNNDNEVRFTEKKYINNNESIKFKNYKRKSFDDNKIRVRNNLEYNKKHLLNHRYSIANMKTTERTCTFEFYDELTEEINKIVNKIKAKPNDLKKRENLFNYIKLVAKKIFPNSKAYKYGSIENGFSLTNGDIDICILNNKEFNNTPAECVEILGEKLKEDGINDIKLLIRARVPIIKMKDNKSGISCDIGFQNKLAIQNTKLINAYSKIDDRFKQMVFIIKYWSKMKNINEPYMGTLSSYCFILMIIHFLQIKEPPVLPNLQKIYLDNFIEYEYIDDFNVSFFENIDELHKYWNSKNNESLGELLVEFFKYYANDFPYITGVASIRVGNIITKEEKKWTREHQFEINKSNSVKDRYWFCVEDPFEITHNLGRPVDRKSLFRIRGEFLKAVKIINNKNLTALQVLEKLLEKNI
jgi:DNA polymerase sigma